MAQFHANSATQILPPAKCQMEPISLRPSRLFLLCTNLSFPRAEMQFKCCRVAKRNFNVHHLNGKTFELNNPDVLGVTSNQEPGPPHQLSLFCICPVDGAYVDHFGFWPFFMRWTLSCLTLCFKGRGKKCKNMLHINSY